MVMWRLRYLLLAVLLYTGCVPASMAQSLPAYDPGSLGARWIDISMAPTLVEWYNRTARPDDIARVDHVSLVDLLDEIKVGRKLVVFKSLRDAEVLVPRLAGKMDIIGYNLEHGPANPPDEQADPVGSVQRMRALADQYGLELALGPDRTFALEEGMAMAPYVDIFVLQVQRVQTEPEVVRDFVLSMVQGLRQANPNIQVSVQVRTEGDVIALTALLDSMKDSLEGVSILTSPETTDVALALVGELRPPLPVQAEPDKPMVTEPAKLPAETLKPRRTPVPTGPEAPAAAAEASSLAGWAIQLGALLAGVVVLGGMAATAFVHALRSWRER